MGRALNSLREHFGWGRGTGMTFRAHTHISKLIACPKEARKRSNGNRRQPRLAFLVFERDGFRCRKCDFRSVKYNGLETGWGLTVDHVVPRSCGGTDELFNLTTLCFNCNTRRGAYLPNPLTLL